MQQLFLNQPNITCCKRLFSLFPLCGLLIQVILYSGKKIISFIYDPCLALWRGETVYIYVMHLYQASYQIAFPNEKI